MKLLEALERYPVETRNTLLTDANQLAEVRELLQPTRAGLEEIESWLPDLFSRFLPKFQPSATILHLGSGLGIELLHSRNLIPQGTLITADKRISPSSVITEILSKAVFIPADFTQITPHALLDIIFSKTNKTPDAVICRHPDIEANPWWPEFLAKWATIVREKMGSMQLLITNYSHKIERLPILKALNQKGIVAQVFDFDDGAIKENPDCPDQIFRHDNFITVFPPLP